MSSKRRRASGGADRSPATTPRSASRSPGARSGSPAGDRSGRAYGTQWKMIGILTLTWVLLTGRLSLGVVVAGFLLGALITRVFPLPPVSYRGRMRPSGQLRLLGRLLYDLVTSSFAVALIAFQRGTPRSAVLRVQLRSDSDLYQTLTTELVSLVPGTLVVEARRSTRTIYIHVLGVHSTADLEQARRQVLAVEESVLRAYGSTEELAALGTRYQRLGQEAP
jgi:multicomponent Na+:H+ antiporter subunit E